MKVWLCFFALSMALLAGDARTKLPDWAVPAAMLLDQEKAPPGVDAWVLLHRTEIAYVGQGEIHLRRFRLVQVLTERGRNQGVFSLGALGGRASKVKRILGWNLRPDGDVEKLDRSDAITINDVGDEEFSTSMLTSVVFQRVQKGSLVAFESLESLRNLIGPVWSAHILETVPVRRWELELAKDEGWFTSLKDVFVAMEKHQFQPWIVRFEEHPDTRLALSNLPALPEDEGGHPNLEDVLPSVRVRFLDPALEVARLWWDWDVLARWMEGQYRAKATPSGSALGVPGPDSEGLRDACEGMQRTLFYKAVYLSPDRGWLPLSSDEVLRRRYGDCKDLTCLLMAQAGRCGFQAYPALCSIGGAEARFGKLPFPSFNHVITAIRLSASLGLPAEVETPKGRFLLVDPTGFQTPFGWLGEAHRGGHVLLCLDTGWAWVPVPLAAIQPSHLDLEMHGTAQANGRVVATLQVAETGDAWGLRSTARSKGLKGVEDRLVASVLALTPLGKARVKSMGDPLDLKRPFQVIAELDHPLGLQRVGNEWEYAGWGIPQARSPIQKAGTARVYPVQARWFGDRDLRVTLTVPDRVQPLLGSGAWETPFASFSWSAQAQPAGAGTELNLRFQHRWKDADFGFERREEGVQAWRRDRTLFNGFREEALTFKRVP